MVNIIPASICSTPEPTDYSLLTPEEKQNFNFIARQLRKHGHDQNTAQEMAYQHITCDDIPFTCEQGL